MYSYLLNMFWTTYMAIIRWLYKFIKRKVL